ncbi:hypothetical protein J2751_000668 [Halorubrum alkaliphilum]|uniref:Uncharacterized protein n=1 Tax=Halorubrum alkaliphilum TaxID=261290 RepID=A0A8T4GF31_9EURY|nr:hypothetical protein [Halorubrum alkaliphilum]MBP1921675.1 hypothetical protein [Halorubrum alkaliphilum]
MHPPIIPTDRLDGWRQVERTTERPFAAGPVSVTAGTVRYERTDRDEPRPFFFASRLRIRPGGTPNPALTRLVENRARAGFRDRLGDRDIEAVETRSERSIRVDDPDASTATLVTYRARCVLPAGGVPVEALLAVWESGEYLIAGGAYRVDEGDDVDADDARRELLGLVRGVRAD